MVQKYQSGEKMGFPILPAVPPGAAEIPAGAEHAALAGACGSRPRPPISRIILSI